MPLYHVPALGTSAEEGGIRPDLPGDNLTWAGVHDPESNTYVVNVRETIEGLTALEPGTDVGFDYAGVVGTVFNQGTESPDILA